MWVDGLGKREMFHQRDLNYGQSRAFKLFLSFTYSLEFSFNIYLFSNSSATGADFPSKHMLMLWGGKDHKNKYINSERYHKTLYRKWDISTVAGKGRGKRDIGAETEEAARELLCSDGEVR